MATASPPPYLRIAAELTRRIAEGELGTGERVPSTRQITAEFGVAMATASKVLAHLRQQGLVRAEPGVGTVVVAATRRTGRPRKPAEQPLDITRERILHAAVTIADREGLPALSMRRLGGALGLPTMSLYRHVTDKEDLLLQMMDIVFARNPPPTPPPPGWRRQVEALARLQWRMYRRHPWLAQAMSFTRPLLAPHAMAHTEWAMQAFGQHGFDTRRSFLAAVTLANYVRGTAVNLEAEAQAEQETGLTGEQWLHGRRRTLAAVLATGRFPEISRFANAADNRFDLDPLMEFGLQRLLDGLSPMLDR